MKSQTIQSPEGVRLLMENIWLRHKAGLGQKPDNVFFVEGNNIPVYPAPL